MKRTYNWRPSQTDRRDRYFRVTAPIAGLPDHVDRLGLDNPIEDQGELGSCTGNSSTSAIEIVTGIKSLSRLMAYYNGRLIENCVGEDAGAQIRDVIKGFSTYGCATEDVWPYDISKFAERPSETAYFEGLKLLPLIESYERIMDLNAMKVALAKGLPVVFGFMVPPEFEDTYCATTGVLHAPRPDMQILGGHAVCAVGYDDRDPDFKFIWVRNSWGKAWGIDGHFKMDQRWFTSGMQLVDDMWTVHPKK
jgi:C1A family cysteine protease